MRLCLRFELAYVPDAAAILRICRRALTVGLVSGVLLALSAPLAVMLTHPAG
jgi:hypothetical protein